MDEYDIENHPDLMDPDWRRHAEKEAWVDLRRNRGRAKWRKGLTTAAVVVVVVAGAGVGFYVWGKSTAEQSTDADVGAPASVAVATTEAAPTELPDEGHVDLTRPFEGTPAQNWAEGIAGLTVPAAAKVGSFSAKQVGQAEDQVKQAIAVAQFDPDTVDRHNPAKYIGLLAPDERPDARANPQSFVIYLADGYHLLPVSPRMTGSMTVKPGKAGELLIHATYVVAYAFDPGEHPVDGPADLEPFVRVDADYAVRSGSHWRASSRGLWVDKFDPYFTSVACGKDDRLTPAFSDRDYAATSLSPEPGRFDPNKPMPTEDNCHGTPG
ncbi:hypothetical protein QRX50_00185 [Amycolatopsis carbonis]|uniref:Uncharacterized protein n=1 Tax=Amycolatopsis carbonis TaxID=715471 RepID=A0A9Y2MXW9_9PSEU|nr:hypothetical protein [Amycolatopsis sp. 2-15]WIX79272.1 hypothetical protein QRX50_00185 [Amycolatopsis sp. 2-15]